MSCEAFYWVDFSHINRPAHLLAKYVLGIVDYSTWIEENPYFLMQALIHDVSLSIWFFNKISDFL